MGRLKRQFCRKMENWFRIKLSRDVLSRDSNQVKSIILRFRRLLDAKCPLLLRSQLESVSSYFCCEKSDFVTHSTFLPSSKKRQKFAIFAKMMVYFSYKIAFTGIVGSFFSWPQASRSVRLRFRNEPLIQKAIFHDKRSSRSQLRDQIRKI